MNLQDLIKLTNSEEVAKLIYKLHLLELEKAISFVENRYWYDDGKSLITYISEELDKIETKLDELK
jgi:hypothetical protein